MQSWKKRQGAIVVDQLSSILMLDETIDRYHREEGFLRPLSTQANTTADINHVVLLIVRLTHPLDRIPNKHIRRMIRARYTSWFF